MLSRCDQKRCHIFKCRNSRRICERPANKLSPADLASVALKGASDNGLDGVLEKRGLSLGMGAIQELLKAVLGL
ncbi:MAG: hypothetical protein CM1200mP39_13440 [Dehalococcoidia bacterium]|nr:MAG: hypothetical protein CM1200mP39_13440 [Dehalococcoidia bacterium]